MATMAGNASCHLVVRRWLLCLYRSLVNAEALEMMRDANWPASLSLYWACGLVWYWNGTLRELIQALQRRLLDLRAK